MAATRAEIESALNGIVRSVLPRAEFRAELKLTPREITGWDSLNLMKILSRLEKQFAIKFTASELPDLRTLGDLINLVSAKAEAKSGVAVDVG